MSSPMKRILLVAAIAGGIIGCSSFWDPPIMLETFPRGRGHSVGRILNADNAIIGQWELVISADNKWTGDIRVKAKVAE